MEGYQGLGRAHVKARNHWELETTDLLLLSQFKEMSRRVFLLFHSLEQFCRNGISVPWIFGVTYKRFGTTNPIFKSSATVNIQIDLGEFFSGSMCSSIIAGSRGICTRNVTKFCLSALWNDHFSLKPSNCAWRPGEHHVPANSWQ